MVQDLNDKNSEPLLFLPFRQEGWNGMDLFINSSVDVSGGLRAGVAGIDESLPLRDVSILNKAIERQEWFFTLLTQMFSGFALIALLMASVGLYAVIAHATRSLTQEIGVRMALGADTSNIMMLVMKRGLWQIAVGLALGLGADSGICLPSRLEGCAEMLSKDSTPAQTSRVQTDKPRTEGQYSLRLR
jgi:putative ABC transport system permease protein